MQLPAISRRLKILCGAIGVVAVIALIAYKLSGRKSLATAYVELLQASHAPIIAKLQEEEDKLKEQNKYNSAASAKTRQAIQTRKAKLKEGFESADLDGDDIVRRLEDLDL